MYEVILGRSEADKKDLGLTGTIFLGKLYVKMGAETSLSNKVYMDVAKAHVILVCGKRGTGKSYSLSMIAEEMANLPEEISHRLAVLMIDTMGIFWTMKYPNEKDEDLLEQWQLPKKGLDVKVYTPAGKFEEYKEKGIPTDYPFTINPAELTAEEWCSMFSISLLDEYGVALERALDRVRETKQIYGVDDLIAEIQGDKKIEEKIKLALENRLAATKTWGIFSKESTPLKKIITGGQVSILDISVYKEWSIKTLVVGLICKKLMQERMEERKKEELEDIQRSHSYFKSTLDKKEETTPIAWIMIDEAHEFLPREGKTLATDALVQVLREGRQPGVCLVLATQQPGEIHKDVTTQTDIVISHRITAKRDVEALNAMMQSYLSGDIQKYLNLLPTMRGAAVILDDNSEKLYPVQVRPKFTWHGGEAPTAVKAKGKAAVELGL
ncbi:ATP-binding protein [Candidatus Woesearchaeota archaeon]|nr:ATP-binding protein [Candidatus Woesearchaeota archaeon]